MIAGAGIDIFLEAGKIYEWGKYFDAMSGSAHKPAAGEPHGRLVHQL